MHDVKPDVTSTTDHFLGITCGQRILWKSDYKIDKVWMTYVSTEPQLGHIASIYKAKNAVKNIFPNVQNTARIHCHCKTGSKVAPPHDDGFLKEMKPFSLSLWSVYLCFTFQVQASLGLCAYQRKSALSRTHLLWNARTPIREGLPYENKGCLWK